MTDTALSRLFPPTIGQEFPGPRWVVFVFYALTALTVWRSQHHILAPDGGAQSIATIPLDRYPSGAAETIIGIFALWGLSQIIVAALYLLCAVRYRAMIPLMLVLFTFEYAARLGIGMSKSIETTGTAPGAIINGAFVVLGCGLVTVTLWGRRSRS